MGNSHSDLLNLWLNCFYQTSFEKDNYMFMMYLWLVTTVLSKKESYNWVCVVLLITNPCLQVCFSLLPTLVNEDDDLHKSWWHWFQLLRCSMISIIFKFVLLKLQKLKVKQPNGSVERCLVSDLSCFYCQWTDCSWSILTCLALT